ncbi:MAG: phospholipase D family protein [Planctomycetota bacterium]|nr:phospholipase D family protein [Planctomycetota bacterium]
MQKRAYSVLILILLVGGMLIGKQFQQSNSRSNVGDILRDLAGGGPAAQQDGISVYFSPHGGCEAAVVQQIGLGRQTIDMQAYSFTSMAVAHALADAESRGVHVRAVLDRTATDEHSQEAAYLQEHGIPVYTDGDHPIAHNKVIVVDGQNVITGSFNYTHQAENANAENLVILTGKLDIAAAYERNFELHLGHSQPFSEGAIPSRSGRSR